MGEAATRDKDFADRMGVTKGNIILELGWDDDCDSAVSESLEEVIGEPLLDDPDTDEIVDVVLLWWRDDDGDLVDGLVDATRALAEDGQIWLVTPGAGQAGTVPPGDIAENAQLAGLVQTSALRLGDWQGSCLVQRGTRRN